MAKIRARIWTDELVVELRRLHAQQLSPEAIAPIMKIGKETIYNKLVGLGLPRTLGKGNDLRGVRSGGLSEYCPKPSPLDQAKLNLGNNWRYDPYNGYTVRIDGKWKPVTVQQLIEMGAE